MYSDLKSPVLQPPRFLAGLTLLFWGALTDELLVGLLIALLLEAKSYVKWSWDFDDHAYVKAFQMSLGFLGLTLFLVWLGEINHNSLFQVMKWFPLSFLPIELAQRYGKRDRMNLNTFFFFSRQRMRQDIKEGRNIDPKTINTGYIYIFIVLLVASCTDRMDIYVHVAMMTLVGIIISSVTISRGLGWKRLIWALPVMLIISSYFQTEIVSIYKSYVATGRPFKEQDVGESSPQLSTLGQLGKIKLNPAIQWRMWGDEVPGYLRLNSYNKYHGAMWSYDFKSVEFQTMEDAFDSRLGIEQGGEGTGVFVFDTKHEPIFKSQDASLSKVQLRGKGKSDTVESIVPSAEGLLGIEKMSGIEVKAAVHPLGVLKLINRKEMIDYQLTISDKNRLDSEPDELFDLAINQKFIQAVSILSEEMKLKEAETAGDKVNVIRDFFMQEFTYALHFDLPTKGAGGADIESFMLHDRRGHCEYFATAAALLLRHQGIPTRYCVGYVVKEKDDDTWIMRGTHAHAWCSAWINGKWEIVDLTPPDWLSQQDEANPADWAQGFRDWFQNVKQDFAIWRTNPQNQSTMSTVIWGLGILLVLWIAFRLYRARSRVKEPITITSIAMAYQVSLEFAGIEKQLATVIGPRSVAQTYFSWVNESAGKVDPPLFDSLVDLVALHEKSRFGGMDHTDEISSIIQKIKSLLK